MDHTTETALQDEKVEYGMTDEKKLRKKCGQVYVVGHKNPDTDSICSAIAYAALKTKLTGIDHVPCRAGQLNEETQFVLEQFHIKKPKLLSDLRLQVKDVELADVDGVKGSVSIRTAWYKMKELNLKTLPVTRDGRLEGLITIGDIATSYMDVYDSDILSTARTQYRNIAGAVGGEVLIGNPHSYLQKGKVAVATSSRQLMSSFIKKDDLIIVGDRPDAQQYGIDADVGCLVVCHNAPISEDIQRRAEEKQIVIIKTPVDTFTAARQINQSIPVRFFMSCGELVTFRMDEFVDDVKEVMARKKYRDFPVVDDNGQFLGFISRRRLLKNTKKKVILVDHNEKNQAVDGVEEAEVLEIIDHHRLSSIETMAPVYFRNQPVGCTATIVFQMYREAGEMPTRDHAALLCCAIISDTLMFRSPTCTSVDEETARELASIAGIDMETMAKEMFRAGSNLKNKSAREICFLDFKKFTVNGTMIGVGQVNSMSRSELREIKDILLPVLDEARTEQGLDMIFFMLTHILSESTELLCAGTSAKEYMITAFDLSKNTEELILKGVVSRKKQLVPTIVSVLQQ